MSTPGLTHEALFYASDEEYVRGISEFVRAGAEDGGAALVAVPEPHLDLVRPSLAGLDSVRFVDMRKQGANPARILPFIREFLDTHQERPVRFVGEPIWAGRTSEEIVEAHRHEALINEAFALRPAHIVCPYDLRDLDPEIIRAAELTHPILVRDGQSEPSARYADPLVVYAAEDQPLSPPAAPFVRLELECGLAGVRRQVRAFAAPTGMSADRVSSFVIAANEAAANALAHAHDGRSGLLWRDDRGLVCEISNTGRIGDPLVGRRTPPPEQEHGRGVWLINQLSDLVELRTGAAGTVVRIHMRLQ